MKHRHFSVLLAAFSLALPLRPAGAQAPYSPASPPNTGNSFGGLSAPRPVTPPRTPTAVQPGVPPTGFPGQTGGYPAAAVQLMNSEPIDPGHKLGRGDVLSYRVVEDRDDKIWPLQVTDSGEVDLPLGGRLKAAGKTTDQLRSDIKSLLEREYYYHATVIMGLNNVAQRASRGRVFVFGAVRSVGPVELPLDTTMTASQAIYQMGGPKDFANLKRTVVFRKGGPKEGIPVNVSAVEKGELEKDVILEPGDTVKVPEASIGIKF